MCSCLTCLKLARIFFSHTHTRPVCLFYRPLDKSLLIPQHCSGHFPSHSFVYASPRHINLSYQAHSKPFLAKTDCIFTVLGLPSSVFQCRQAIHDTDSHTGHTQQLFSNSGQPKRLLIHAHILSINACIFSKNYFNQTLFIALKLSPASGHPVDILSLKC